MENIRFWVVGGLLVAGFAVFGAYAACSSCGPRTEDFKDACEKAGFHRLSNGMDTCVERAKTACADKTGPDLVDCAKRPARP